MGRTSGSRGGTGLERTRAQRGSGWEEAGLALALATAAALWVGVLAGIAAPLGGALARLEAHAPPAPSCATPTGAIASAAPARGCP
jgi:hypothetical protein